MKALRATILVCLLLPIMIILSWFFYFRHPSQDMIQLLNGDTSINVETISFTTVPSGEVIILDDPASVQYFSESVRRARREGHTPSKMPSKQYYAIVRFGVLSRAKIGIYPSPANRGFTVYYPYHEDGPTGIEYYWIRLEGQIPNQFLDFYNRLCKVDGLETLDKDR